VFATREGTPILISIQNDREWVVLARDVMTDADLAADTRLANNVGRCTHRAEMDGRIARWFATQSKDAAIAGLMRHDIAFGLVSDVAGLAAHPHLREVTVETPGGPVTMPAPAARHPGEPPSFAAVPAVGAHTAAVRREFQA
jgi:crotonobetainyl-CoA:carnitine CoA-transferase CaiB-like acyl-CoA transferase